MVLDAGGTIGSTNIVSEIEMLYHTHAHTLMSTCAAECMRQYLNDCVEFVSDLHTISKVKVSTVNPLYSNHDCSRLSLTFK